MLKHESTRGRKYSQKSQKNNLISEVAQTLRKKQNKKKKEE